MQFRRMNSIGLAALFVWTGGCATSDTFEARLDDDGWMQADEAEGLALMKELGGR